MAEEQKEKHKILIVGGGAAGLELATSLGNKLGKPGLAEVTLLDAATNHIWKPLLHEIAAGTLDETEQVDYLGQGFRNHFRFMLGKMEGLNREKKEIYTSPVFTKKGEELVPARSFRYDTLVLSVGSVSNTYNTQGVAENCLFLDTTQQALKFQKYFIESYIRRFVNNQRRQGPFSIVIIGAGATGVELAAQLHEVTHLLAAYGLKMEGNVKLTIIEGATQLLPALPRKLAEATQQQLEALGVDLKLGRRVVEVSNEYVKTHDGETVPADFAVWAAGIKAPDWMKNLDGLETNHINQLMVDSTLKTRDDAIFAIGDCAACVWEGNTGNVPPRAQAAHQQASTLAKSIVNRIKGNGNLVHFTYHDYGSLVSLGKYTTVGNLMGSLMGSVSIGGFIAKLVYLALYKMHQVAIHGYFRTAMLTLSNIFRRSAYTKVKMH